MCNVLVILKLVKIGLNRKQLQLLKKNRNINFDTVPLKQLNNANKNLKLKPHYFTYDQIMRRKLNCSKNSSKKITIQLVIISFSYVLLNLPYSFTWFMMFVKQATKNFDKITQNHLFLSLQICEIFFLLNYSLKFYIYISTSSNILSQIKYTSCLILFILSNQLVLKLFLILTLGINLITKKGKKKPNYAKIEYYIQ